jgi:quinol monooxygenase YgiN
MSIARLVFIEQWADRAALLADFAVPASRDYDAIKLEKL